MEEKDNAESNFLEGEIVGIKFGLATHKEISTASISGCPISHSSQLTNPFLGLPLEFGKCESCGTSEPGKCEGHFGYIELPIPIYHPSHVIELKRLLSSLCLKCLKLKTNKFQVKSSGVAERLFSCCEEAAQVSIREVQKTGGSYMLELKLPARGQKRYGSWNFLERYGFRYGDERTRPLLPCEVKEMLRRIPQDTRKKLAKKGYFPQDGYIMQYVPVPPNCLSVPDISDGVSVMSSDLSVSMLKKVLKQVEIIKSSRSGEPNFESHEVEAIDLQLAVDQYLQVRGTSKSARDVGERFGVHRESSDSTTKAWLDKMKTLFIRKGSGFSSRSVITGDGYKRVNEIGIPSEIAQRITFEERVNSHNVQFLQELVDNKLCLAYKDGSSVYSLREGSKGHTFLRPGQVVHRRIMDGDMVFINRPPTTHKHSLQALSVYVHDGHTVKINPLICGPLSADFDGDCIHLFYPQSLAAKAEVLELFSVEKQLLSSHSGNLNLQLTSDSLLSLKTMFKAYFLDKAAAQQLAMFVFSSSSLPQPAVRKGHCSGPIWTALQILQTALPSHFHCAGERYLICNSDLLEVDFSRDIVQAVINEVVISIFFEKGPDAVFKFFNSLQPLLMESLFSEGCSVGLKDFYMSRAATRGTRGDFRVISSLLGQLRSTYNELMELQLDSHIRRAKLPVAEFIVRASSMGDLIDYKSDSAMTKVVQQIGFLGRQISDRGKFYTKTLVQDLASHFESKYPSDIEYPSAKHGFIQSCFFHGLDPYEEMVHSISAREVMVRSTRGLAEPGTLFKNLMAILRDVTICYDGTVRNLCSNSIIQFEYGMKAGIKAQSLFPAGEPVGVLAATAMSNPAYKAVLDSTPSSNSSWELMKEILQCRVNFKNDINDRRSILYFNHCGCGKLYCQEKMAYSVKNHLEKVILKDVALSFMIEYKSQQMIGDAGVLGHVHLEKDKLQKLNVSMEVILQKCEESVASLGKKKKKNINYILKRIGVSFSECCTFQCADERSGMPCLMFFWKDITDTPLEESSQKFADVVCPVLLDTVIKGDHRVSSANIIWVSVDATTWIRNPCRTEKGEVALDVTIEKSAVRQSGDAWRVVLDSCIPVLHMIDTRRSIPYAIKQVQELLGVSCAFDQAVQRLQSSVTKVAKGVLKEHLLLLANSMTCAGNLVGFTTGGYKSLFHSLNVQVPFTEATLFTPRRIFERAAEKCHVDSLSSVIASCSWGKHVAVGTGSCFDLLWDHKEACLNQEGNTDVYEFLNMVNASANGEESATVCLGTEVDDLSLNDEIDDWNLSPERDVGTDKPVFEDSDEFKSFLDNQPAKVRWGADKDESWSTWGKNTADKDESWSAWGKNTADKDESGSTWGKKAAESIWGKKAANEDECGSTWGKKAADADESGSTWGKKPADKDESWSTWGKSTTEPHNILSVKAQEEPNTSIGWDAAAPSQSNADTNWGVKKSQVTDACATDAPSTNVQEETARTSAWNSDVAWGRSGGWASSAKNQSASSQGWSKSNAGNTDEGDGLQKWEKPESPQVSQHWDSHKESSEAVGSGWALPNPGGGDADEKQQKWGKPKSPQVSQHWGSPKQSSEVVGSGWGLPNPGGSDEFDVNEKQQKWEKPKSPQVSQGWGSPKESNETVGSGWGLPNPGGSDGSEKQQRWGKQSGEFKKGRGGGARGWGSNNAEWKGKNRPAKPQGNTQDDSGFSQLYTVTRQRLDMFTSQEQDILSVMEPLMRSIRKIIHLSGYNDADPLSATDQSFVVDNVFNYHPDKAAKMGAGIDHITVSKHSSFQDSRCFYVVSTDGSRQDFSYRKCLESFIKEKYPDLAEEFIGKYFKPRQRGNQPQTPGAETPAGETQVVETPVTAVGESIQDDTRA